MQMSFTMMAQWRLQGLYAISDGEPLLSDGNRKQKKSN
jgi:hypothetical protein